MDPSAQTFVFDWGGVAEQNEAMLASENLMFHASPDGVRVEFATGTPREILFEGHPAFEADFPPVLFYMQRREYFRVEAPVLDPYICSGVLPSGERFRFEVNDLSLGGVALRTMDERVATMEVGMILRAVELHFSNPGKVVLDLQLMSNRQTVNTGRSALYAGLQVHELAGFGGKHAAAPDHATRDEAPVAGAMTRKMAAGPCARRFPLLSPQSLPHPLPSGELTPNLPAASPIDRSLR